MEICAALAVSEPPLFDFLFDLMVDPACAGIVDRSGTCRCTSNFQFHRSQLDSLALEWASEENLNWPDRVALLLRLDQLPWHCDQITFQWDNVDEIDCQPG